MTSEPLGLNGDPRGCEDGPRCERHRALAGQLQSRLMKMFVSAALSVWFGGAVDLGWPSGVEASVKFVSAPQNYMPAFTAPMAGGGSDPVIHQVPNYYGSLDKLTWTLVIKSSGTIFALGNEDNFKREVWGELGYCLRGDQVAIVFPYSGTTLDGFPPTFGDYSMGIRYVETVNGYERVIAETVGHEQTWQVTVYGRERVDFIGLDESQRRLWRVLAKLLPDCGETR